MKNLKIKRMGLGFWMRSKKLFTIKKCKERFRNNSQENCKKLEGKKLYKKKKLLKLKLLSRKQSKKVLLKMITKTFLNLQKNYRKHKKRCRNKYFNKPLS